MSHKTQVCKLCSRVVSTCRCFNAHKHTEYVICDRCRLGRCEELKSDKAVARRAAEKAWDEGYRAGKEDEEWHREDDDNLTPNPYATPEESDDG